MNEKLKHPQVRLYDRDYEFIKRMAKERVTPMAQIIHEFLLTLSYQGKVPEDYRDESK